MRRHRVWWAIGVLVLCLHSAFLLWAQSLWQPKSRIQLMAEPVYARLIAPKEPAALPKPKQKSAPVAQPQAAVQRYNAVASRPLPEAPPPPESTAPALIPPPPALDAPLFSALADDRPEPWQPPVQATPSPTPTDWPQEAVDLALAPHETLLPTEDSAPLWAPEAEATAPDAPLALGNADEMAAGDAGSVANGGEASEGTAEVYQDWPHDTRINLKVSGYFRGNISGSGKVTWQRQDQRYQAQVVLGFGIGSLTMTSQGEVSDEGLNPSIFEEKIMGRLRTARFEPEAITVGSGKRIPRMGLSRGLGPGSFQDSASQFVELAWRFATGRASLAAGETVSYWLGRPEGLYQYIFDIHGPQPMDLPKLGRVNTWHLVPRPIPGLNKDAIYGEIWVAPSLQYLPVKIRMRNAAGMQMDMVVDTMEQSDGQGPQP